MNKTEERIQTILGCNEESAIEITESIVMRLDMLEPHFAIDELVNLLGWDSTNAIL